MNLKLILTFFILNCVCSAFSGQQELSTVAKKLVKELHISEEQLNLNLYSEKVMPADPGRSIYVLPTYSKNAEYEFDENMFEIDENIIVANNTTGEIYAKYQMRNAYESDAIALRNFTIDTGLYNLNEATRAFAIRADYRGMSRANPYDYTTLKLFIEVGNNLEVVLNDFEIEKITGAWDTRCEGEFTDRSGVLLIEKQKTRDFNNLKVKFNIVKSKAFEKDGNCEETQRKSSEMKILKFNGKEYK